MSELSNAKQALRVAAEHCARNAVPKQNWGQFVSLVKHGLGDSEETDTFIARLEKLRSSASN